MVAFILYRRNSLRGGLLLISAIPYFFISRLHDILGGIQPNLPALRSPALCLSLCFNVALTTIDLAALSKNILRRLPHRGIAIFMFVAGIGTFSFGSAS